MRSDEMQLSRGEALRDTAWVLGRHVAAVGLRTGSEETLEELAGHSPVPVINMLSPRHHPCQALADLLTLREACGSLAGLRVAYVGDGNNVARSLAVLGTLAGMHVAIASPAYCWRTTYRCPRARGLVTLYEDPYEAVRGARAVYTDVWVSMGDEEEAGARRRRSPPTGSTTRCSTRPPRAPSRCTTCPRTRRGDLGRGPLRGAPAHLGAGREPPSRAEGAARAAARARGERAGRGGAGR
jgi:hypothetical protein